MEDKHARDTAFLNDYADRQWEVRGQYIHVRGFESHLRQLIFSENDCQRVPF